MEKIHNPYGVPITFMIFNKEENGLSSPVITGEVCYVFGKVKRTEHFEVAFGYSFEQLILYAWSLGIGTTWIGGTMNREVFEKVADLAEDEVLPIVTPLGYPAKDKAEVDRKLRESVHGDERLRMEELFFEKDFSTPVHAERKEEWMEAVRWSPSAANMQPCRVVVDGNHHHFYLKRTMDYVPSAPWDVQKIDVGIALYHFIAVTGGTFSIADPGIKTTDDTVYIATVTV